MALEDQLQPHADHITDVWRQMGRRTSDLKGRIPNFHGKDVQGPENFPGVYGRKNSQYAALMLAYLLLQVSFALREVGEDRVWLRQ
jgi:hypothetical protein